MFPKPTKYEKINRIDGLFLLILHYEDNIIKIIKIKTKNITLNNIKIHLKLMIIIN